MGLGCSTATRCFLAGNSLGGQNLLLCMSPLFATGRRSLHYKIIPGVGLRLVPRLIVFSAGR